jgi:prepilin-type N-terminal cleavage/methylation domain-containing protein
MTIVYRRPGVTLVEMIVALTLFGIITTIMLRMLSEQHRFHIGSLEIIDTKRSTHQAIQLLYGELRALSTADIYAMSDSSIAFRTTHGISHICGIDSARASIALPSTRTTRFAPLSALLTVPRAGDSVLIFDPGDAPDPADDRWHAHLLVADLGSAVCPPRPFGLASNAAETAGIAIAIVPPVTATVPIGSPLRFFRPARYSLYRSGSSWMLGYSLCAASVCTTRQPLSGPYLPFASGGAGGVVFQYVDAQGATTSDRSRVKRIDLVVRAQSASTLDLGHLRGQRYQDSVTMTIALRNGS